MVVVRPLLHEIEDHYKGTQKSFRNALGEATEFKGKSDHCKLILLWVKMMKHGQDKPSGYTV